MLIGEAFQIYASKTISAVYSQCLSSITSIFGYVKLTIICKQILNLI